MAALLVQTFTNPPGATNYLILTYTNGAPADAGIYYAERWSASGEAGTDMGSFSETAGEITTKFAGPATVAGWQSTITPRGAAAFTRSYGNGTFASIATVTNEPVDVGIILVNTRVTTNTGVAELLALAPPYAVEKDSGTFYVTWGENNTSTKLSSTFTEADSTLTGAITYVPEVQYAPAALSGHTITATDVPQKPGEKNTIATFTNNIFATTGGTVTAGTYTYAPYTPTMALVTFTLTGTGENRYLLLNFESHTSGAYVSSRPDTAVPGGWNYGKGNFSMK
jgi:hypothetical protein